MMTPVQGEILSSSLGAHKMLAGDMKPRLSTLDDQPNNKTPQLARQSCIAVNKG